MQAINYAIIRRPRRKTASIVIRPDNRIEVLAPSRMPTKQIEQFVQDQSTWIRRKLHFNREIRAAYQPRSFTAGEMFQLLGRAYPLTICAGTPLAQLSNDQLVVSLPQYHKSSIDQLITAWYRQQAENHFSERCHILATKTGKYPTHVGVKTYKSRWGSCHHDGRIYFNWRLMMAPEWVVDYVVIHELCHLIHANHSSAFWALVQSLFPACPEAKKWLKINGLTLSL